MKDELIKRIDAVLDTIKPYDKDGYRSSDFDTWNLLHDCRTAIERITESLKESRALSLKFAQEREQTDEMIERLQKPYVPMTDEQCDAIISNLDDIARDVGLYEYGLPMMMEHSRNLMREAIRNGINSK